MPKVSCEALVSRFPVSRSGPGRNHQVTAISFPNGNATWLQGLRCTGSVARAPGGGLVLSLTTGDRGNRWVAHGATTRIRFRAAGLKGHTNLPANSKIPCRALVDEDDGTIRVELPPTPWNGIKRYPTRGPTGPQVQHRPEPVLPAEPEPDNTPAEDFPTKLGRLLDLMSALSDEVDALGVGHLMAMTSKGHPILRRR